MTKYIAVIDWNARTGKMFDHIELNAKNIVDAMNEAENYINEDVYMIFIAEKTGKVTKVDDCKEVLYKEILANRKNGWHACDEKHSEHATTWKASFAKFGKWFDIA